MLKDSGHGVTDESKKFWASRKEALGDVTYVRIQKEGVRHEMKNDGNIAYPIDYTMVLQGKEDVMYLSGTGCGYGGEGPNLTANILAELGVPLQCARIAMWHNDIICQPSAKEIVLDGELINYTTTESMFRKHDIEEWLSACEYDAFFCPTCLSVMAHKGQYYICNNGMCANEGKKVFVADTLSDEINHEIDVERGREVLEEMGQKDAKCRVVPPRRIDPLL